jgi:hypothetical protein
MAKGTPLCIGGVKDGFGHNRTVDIFWTEIPESNRDRKEYLEQTCYTIRRVAVQFEPRGSSQSVDPYFKILPVVTQTL